MSLIAGARTFLLFGIYPSVIQTSVLTQKNFVPSDDISSARSFDGSDQREGNAREAQNQLTSVAGHAGDGSAAPAATPFFLRGSGDAEGTLFP
jgi:hypothetical protein